jgi:hypothetical protein
MKTIVDEIIKGFSDSKLTFAEPFYKSSDGKTIMGEIPFREILFLEYRDTEAGSNPREYIGLVKTNLHIIKSLLKDYRIMFRVLHSGVIVSLTDQVIDENNACVEYDVCCLTNGNQTRFIILILTLLKLFVESGKSLSELTSKTYDDFIKRWFGGSERISSVLQYVKFSKVRQVRDFLDREKKYGEFFGKMDIKGFLVSRIRIQINLIDSIIQEIGELDQNSAGTLIAEANNDTQNVRVDDLFGNKYKKQLEEKLFSEFKNDYKDVGINFKHGENIERGDRVHILTLLRPVVATGILTRDREIYKLTNQREPIYRLFERLLKSDGAEKTIHAINRMIPLLYDLRANHIAPTLDKHKRKIVREYKEKAISNELRETHLQPDIDKARGDDDQIEKVIRRAVGYNIEHITPVLVFRIRKLITDKSSLVLAVPEESVSVIVRSLAESIYNSYVRMKVVGLPSSLTTAVRSSTFYEFGNEAYTVLRNQYDLKETDFIEKNRKLLV